MAPHSSTLAWKIPWTEEPHRLQSMGLRRVRHDWATSLSLFTFMHWRRKWQPLQCSCLENPRDGVAQSQTWLKWLSSSSSRSLYSIHLFCFNYLLSSTCKEHCIRWGLFQPSNINKKFMRRRIVYFFICIFYILAFSFPFWSSMLF